MENSKYAKSQDYIDGYVDGYAMSKPAARSMEYESGYNDAMAHARLGICQFYTVADVACQHNWLGGYCDLCGAVKPA